jgi:hypothetical protein
MKTPFFCLLLLLSSVFVFAQSSYIQVNGEPGLSVYLNNQFKGKTSAEFNGLIIENVTAGKNLIKIEKDGYTPFEENITVKPGEVLAYKVKPFARHVVEISEQGNDAETNKKARIQTGKLIIQSIPIEIKISIPDIEGIQNSPKKKDEWIAEKIPVGTYSITFTYNQKVITKNIAIGGYKTTNVFVNMLDGNITIKNSIDPGAEQELVSSLEEKMKEAEGLYRDFSFGKAYYSELKCFSTPGKAGSLTVSYVRNGDAEYRDKRWTYIFNISQIMSIELNEPGHKSYYNPYGVLSPIGMIEIILSDNSGQFIMSERDFGTTRWSFSPSETCKHISFPFFQSNKSNLDEITEIFEHLKIYNK